MMMPAPLCLAIRLWAPLFLALALALTAAASVQAAEDCGPTRILVEGGDPSPLVLPDQQNETLEVHRDSTVVIRAKNPPSDASIAWSVRWAFGVLQRGEDRVQADGKATTIEVGDFSGIARGTYQVRGRLLSGRSEVCSVQFDVRIAGFGGVVGWTSIGLAAAGGAGALATAQAAGSAAARNWETKVKPQLQRRRSRDWRRWVPVLDWRRTFTSTIFGAVAGLGVAVALQQGGVTPLSLASVVRSVIIGGGLSFGVAVGLGTILTYLRRPMP